MVAKGKGYGNPLKIVRLDWFDSLLILYGLHEITAICLFPANSIFI